MIARLTSYHLRNSRRFVVIIALVAFRAFESSAQLHENIRFRNLNADDGLSGNSAFCLARDHFGRMWIGTYGEGLNVYDGYSFRHFRRNPYDSASLADNAISSLAVDRNNRIWIAHPKNGISVYDPSSDRFRRYVTDTLQEDALPTNAIRQLICDRNGNIWIASAAGLLKYNEKSDGFTRYFMQEKEPSNLFEVYEDKSGKIWVGLHWVPFSGVYVFDPATEKFSHYPSAGEPGKTMSDHSSVVIGEDDAGKIWVGSRRGINVLDPNTGNFELYFSDPANQNTLSGNDFLQGKIMRDSKGNLWIGSYKEGLSIYDPVRKIFIRIRHNPDDPYSISSNNIRDIFEDPSGLIWIVTNGGGISIYDPYFNQFRIYTHVPGVMTSPAGSEISNMAYDKIHERIWLSYSSGGLDQWDAVTGGFTHYDNAIFAKAGQNPSFIKDIYPEADGNVLICFFGGGIMRFDHQQKKLQRTKFSEAWVNCVTRLRNGNYLVGTNQLGINEYDADEKLIRTYGFSPNAGSTDTLLRGGMIKHIYETNNGDWWALTESGISRFNMMTGQFENYSHDPGNASSISDNNLRCIYEAKDGRILLGTGYGIDQFNADTKAFTHLGTDDGLPDGFINGITEDVNNNLWIATAIGLCRYTTADKSIKVFNKLDGIPGNYTDGIVGLNSGKLFCGVEGGFFILDPLQENICTHAPEMIFGSMTVKNKPYLDAAQIATAETITLDYSHGFFSIEVTAIDFVSPEKNKYTYRLTGLNDQWVDMGTRRELTFTGLPPGEYLLHVKAANSHGTWNEEGLQLKIIITPPWWRTTTFYVSVLLFLIATVFGLVKWRERKLRADKVRLEEEVKNRTKELSEEKEKVSEQKLIIEEKNKEITDSIVYANRIQKALLSSESGLKKHFDDYFILYKPKDIVSGDFYWTHSTENKIIVCTGDCTGHGVPGAFMSLLNISLLREAVTEHPGAAPNEILNFVRAGISVSLNPEGAEEESKDGMDCVLFAYHQQEKKFEFACANNPLWLWRNGELTEFKPDKMPVGRYHGEEKSFTLQSQQLLKGDIIYTFTDGYADQFGGERGKKFKYSNLKKLLLELSGAETSLSEIHNELLRQHNEWKGKLEQVDDVCIIGVRIR